MKRIIAETRPSIWMIIVACMGYAVMIHPSFWGFVVDVMGFFILLAARKAAHWEGEARAREKIGLKGTAAPAARSAGVESLN